MTSISASLAKLKSLESYLKDPLVLPQPDKFAKAIDRLEKKIDRITTPPLHPNESATPRALQRWQQALQTNCYDEIDSQCFYTLCSLPDVISTPAFLGYLRKRDLPAKALTLLMLSCHREWATLSSKKETLDFVRDRLNDYQGYRKSFHHWKQFSRYLLSQDGPRLCAQELLVNLNTKVADLVERYRLIQTRSLFLDEVATQAADFLCQSIAANIYTFDSNQWDYLFEELADYFADKGRLATVLSTLILTADTYTTENNRTAAQELIKLFMLRKSLFGDPRVYPGNWTSIEPKAKAAFVRWLSEADIRLFFDLIIKEDGNSRKSRKSRKDFWLRYLNSIQDSYVAIGKQDQKAHVATLRRFHEEGRTWAELIGNSERSAFILDFGEYVIVEFSPVGRAYIYKKSTFLQRQKKFNLRSIRGLTAYRDSNLTDTMQYVDAEFAIVHASDKWIDTLRQELARLNIYVDSRL